jgi:hypothetical protein
MWLDKIFQEIYRKTNIGEIDLLNTIHLDPVGFYEPVADASRLLTFSGMFDSYKTEDLPEELKLKLRSLIINEVELDKRFDFKLIDSLTASKSFGEGWHPHINGSWFKNIGEWGEGMYPDTSFGALDDDDWERNIYHIEHEGFHKNSVINVSYYEWLGRYVASQSGGSHHAALVVYQMKKDGRNYIREANVEKVKFNKNIVHEIEINNYCIVMSSVSYSAKCKNPFRTNKTLYILRELCCEQVWEFNFGTSSPQENSLFIIPKNNLKIGKVNFDKWIDYQNKLNNIILFSDLIENPMKYCYLPYIHKLSSIHLGDPCRKSDKITRGMSIEH